MGKRTIRLQGKAILLIVLILMALSLNPLAVCAEEQESEELFDLWAEKLGCRAFFDDLPEAVRGSLLELGIEELDPEQLLSLSPTDFFALCAGVLEREAKRPLGLAAFFLLLIVLGALFEVLTPSARGLQKLFSLLRDGAFCSAVCLPVFGCIEAVFQTVQTAFGMMAALLPAFLSVLATSGRTFTAAAASAFLYGVLSFGPVLMSGFLLPFLQIHLVLRMAGGEETGIQALTDGLYRAVTGIFSGGVTLAVGLWSVQKSMAGAADSAALRTGKWAVSGLVPVVGGTLSEAVSGLSGCLSLLRTTVGSLSCLALTLLFLPPLFLCICWLFVFGVGQLFAGMLGSKTVQQLFSGVHQTQKMLLAVTAVSAAFLLLSLGILLNG